MKEHFAFNPVSRNELIAQAHDCGDTEIDHIYKMAESWNGFDPLDATLAELIEYQCFIASVRACFYGSESSEG